MALPFFFRNGNDPFQPFPALVLPFQVGRIVPLIAEAVDDTAAQFDIGHVLFAVCPEFFPLFVAGTAPSVDIFPDRFSLFQDGHDSLGQAVCRFNRFQPFDETFRHIIGRKEEAFVLHIQSLMQCGQLPRFALGGLLFADSCGWTAIMSGAGWSQMFKSAVVNPKRFNKPAPSSRRYFSSAKISHDRCWSEAGPCGSPCESQALSFLIYGKSACQAVKGCS